jgi:hypothetical protein
MGRPVKKYSSTNISQYYLTVLKYTQHFEQLVLFKLKQIYCLRNQILKIGGSATMSFAAFFSSIKDLCLMYKRNWAHTYASTSACHWNKALNLFL